MGIEVQGDAEHKWQYNGKEKIEELGLNQLDYGARMYDGVLGRWYVIDPLAEANEDFTPYQYGANNPIFNIDFLGLTDVNGDGIDDGTTLPEVVIKGKRNNDNEETLNTIQTTLDVAGWISGIQTVAGLTNAGIDLYRGHYGSALLNLGTSIPIAGYLFKGAKVAAMTTKVVSSMAKMKIIKAAIPIAIRRLAPVGTQIHHIIPKNVYKQYSPIFDQLKNFDIDNIGNLIPLNKSSHGNHPAYSEYVAKELTDLAVTNGGKLTIQHINQTIDKMETIIQNAHNSSLRLNDFIKTLK